LRNLNRLKSPPLLGSAGSVSGARSRPHPNRTIAILLLGAITFSISQTMMNPAFPLIAARYHATESTVAWTLSGFFLAASIAPAISGRLGDMFGKKRALVVALLLFAAGGVVCALAQSIGVMIAGRVVMGTGAGIFPLSYAIVRDDLPPARMAGAVGVLSAMIGVGAGLGFPFGGLMLDGLGLPSVFWTATVLALITAAAVHLGVPESPVRSPGRVDWLGAALFAAGLGAVLGAISQATVWGWLDWRNGLLFFGGLAVLAIFVAVERRTEQPLIHLPTFIERGVLATNLATVLLGGGLVIAFILVPQLAQLPARSGYGFGLNASQSGLFLVPMAALIVIGAPLGGRLIARVGPRALLQIGGLLCAISLVLLAVAHRDPIDLYLIPCILGIGTGLSYAAMPILILRAVRQEQTGEATGMNTMLRNAGGGLGTQVATSLVGGSLSAATALPTDQGFVLAFIAGAVGCLSGLIIASWIPGDRGSRRPANAPSPGVARPPVREKETA
jgi:MFS family permease